MSTLKVNTLTDTAATKSVPIEDVVNGVARAWVNFNGTGTVAIRASYNVTSITDNGTGDYTVNFTTAMTDVNYAGVITTSSDAISAMYTYEAGTFSNSRSTTSFRVNTVSAAPTAVDRTSVNVVIFR
jgi:hypothetical protein